MFFQDQEFLKSVVKVVLEIMLCDILTLRKYVPKG